MHNKRAAENILIGVRYKNEFSIHSALHFEHTEKNNAREVIRYAYIVMYIVMYIVYAFILFDTPYHTCHS